MDAERLSRAREQLAERAERQRSRADARADAVRSKQAAIRKKIAAKRKKPDDEEKTDHWSRFQLLLLLLLLLLLDCRNDAPDVIVEPAPIVVVQKTPVPEPPPPPAPPTGRMQRIERPSFASKAAPPPTWVSSFRMQVAARSPQLASCFEGADRPGRLKWTAYVEPESGRVSDHELEPVLLSDDVSKAERECVFAALSDPPYRLDGEGRSTPSRVGMVIEF